MTAFVKIICLAATIASPQVAQRALGVQPEKPGPAAAMCPFCADSSMDKAVERCVTAAVSPDARVAGKPQIAPGPPPMLSFRYYEGRLHHRNNNSDLMLDDAGH